VRFEAGDAVALREIYRGRVWAARPWTVVRDDSELLVLWIPAGTRTKVPARPTGERLRMQADEWMLVDNQWHSEGTLRLAIPGDAHSILLFWREWTFLGWYVNLEEPLRRMHVGFDYLDHKLDLVIWADGSWEWKDEDELEEAVDAGILTPLDAREIRDEGERVLAQYEIGASPFRDGWENWRPDPAWPVPVLPAGWDTVQSPLS
jgi:predicted RNA-binding protein associated with RNAse of E/G family